MMKNCWSAVHLGCAVAALELATIGGLRLAEAQTTTTPIKHLIVVFQENVSFDHYFGTYPKALNLPGEPRFLAAARDAER